MMLREEREPVEDGIRYLAVSRRISLGRLMKSMIFDDEILS